MKSDFNSGWVSVRTARLKTIDNDFILTTQIQCVHFRLANLHIHL